MTFYHATFLRCVNKLPMQLKFLCMFLSVLYGAVAACAQPDGRWSGCIRALCCECNVSERVCHDAAAATPLGGDRAAENGIVPARPLAVLKTVTQCFDA